MSKILKFYYLVESMIVFDNEKEISFPRILLIIEKKMRGIGNSLP